VEIKFFPERFELIIEDDGIGIPLEQLKNRKENHMGLLNMEERIRTLGGDLTIETKINDGTKIHIKVNTDGADNV
jgi:signal transduction histidine kinase